MKTLQLEDNTARSLYKTASADVKNILEESFGKAFFSTSVFDRFQSWESVAEEIGLHPVNDLPFPNPKNDREEATNAYWQWDWIAEVFNEAIMLDWQNSTQAKWAPWIHKFVPGSGWSFIVSTYGWSTTIASGGARLRFASEKLSDHFAKYFMSIINKLNKPITKR